MKKHDICWKTDICRRGGYHLMVLAMNWSRIDCVNAPNVVALSYERARRAA